MEFDVSINPIDRERLRNSLNPKQLKQANYQIIKRSTRRILVAIKKKIKEASNIKPHYIDQVSKQYPPKADGAGNYVGRIEISKQPLPLIAFGPRITKTRGVTVKLGDKQITFKHAFGAMAGQHKGIFERGLAKQQTNANKPQRLYAGHLPIKELFGPSVFKVVSADKMQGDFRQLANRVLATETKSQLDRFLKPKE